MGDVAREGRTVLFVSHNMQAVRALCQRSLLLESGEIVADGETDAIVRRYLAGMEALDRGWRRWEDRDTQPGNDECRLVEVRVADPAGEVKSSFFSSEEVSVVIELDVLRRDPAMVLVFDLAASDTTVVFRSYSSDPSGNLGIGDQPGRVAARCTIPANLLNSGRYVVGVRIILRGIDGIAYVPDALFFDVSSDHGEFAVTPLHGRPGVIAPGLGWELAEPAEPERDALPRASGAAAAPR